MSWIKGTIDKGLDLIKTGIDKSDDWKFTEEEQSRFTVKMSEIYIETLRVINEESSVRSLTRRFVALPVVYTYLGMLITAFVFRCFGAIETSKDLFTFANDGLGYGFLLVLTFYLGLEGVKRMVKKK